jgi:hypothetical protein
MTSFDGFVVGIFLEGRSWVESCSLVCNAVGLSRVAGVCVASWSYDAPRAYDVAAACPSPTYINFCVAVKCGITAHSHRISSPNLYRRSLFNGSKVYASVASRYTHKFCSSHSSPVKGCGNRNRGNAIGILTQVPVYTTDGFAT